MPTPFALALLAAPAERYPWPLVVAAVLAGAAVLAVGLAALVLALRREAQLAGAADERSARFVDVWPAARRRVPRPVALAPVPRPAAGEEEVRRG